ncbi:MAG: hypothetical protein ACI8WT_001426 [Clostridium sp.]|jgi:hypothetical protein
MIMEEHMAVNKKRKKSINKNSTKKTKITSKKLSKVIMEFVVHLTDKENDTEMCKKIIELGILVWNISVLPIEHRAEQKEMVLKSVNTNIKQGEVDFNEIFDNLIIRKDNIFNNDKRFIVNYEIHEQGNELFLTVGSTQIS